VSLARKLTDLEINGEPLNSAEVRARASQLRDERRAAGADKFSLAQSELQTEALESLIDRLLLVQEARRLDLEPRPSEVDETLAKMAGRYDGVAGYRARVNTPFTQQDVRRRMMVDRILDRWRASVRRPRAEEVSRHYARNKERFYAPERVNAAHIVRSVDRYESSDIGLTEVGRLRTRVEQGEPFAQVAADCSDCPENNGELGWFPRGLMVEEFDEIVFLAPIGELTPVFWTFVGYHFALVHARRPAGIRPLSDVRSEIERALWLGKQDQEVGKRLADLRKRAVIRSIV
jgi:parvulin-like peptidyl-prolyl isomerase